MFRRWRQCWWWDERECRNKKKFKFLMKMTKKSFESKNFTIKKRLKQFLFAKSIFSIFFVPWLLYESVKEEFAITIADEEETTSKTTTDWLVVLFFLLTKFKIEIIYHRKGYSFSVEIAAAVVAAAQLKAKSSKNDYARKKLVFFLVPLFLL